MASKVLLLVSVIAMLSDCTLSKAKPKSANEIVRQQLEQREWPDAESKMEAEKELLHALGLEVPEKVLRGKAKKPPKYMVDLFHAVADDQGIPRNPGVLGVGTVRSIPNRDTRGPEFCKFDLSAVTDKEIVVDAELHLFQSRKGFRNLNETDESSGKRHGPRPPTTYLVKIYQVLTEEANPNPKKKLISARRLHRYHGGWHTFSMFETVEEWLANAGSNHGLEIEMTTENGQPIENLSERESRLTNLVVFTKNIEAEKAKEEYPSETTYSRNRRSLETVGEKSRRIIAENKAKKGNGKIKGKGANARLAQDIQDGGHQKTLEGDNQAPGGEHKNEGRGNALSTTTPHTPEPTESSTSHLTTSSSSEWGCTKYPMYVDFKALGWSWIINPSGYSDHYCDGSCAKGVGSNHAKIQSIFFGPYRQCCVPDKYDSLSMLFVDTDNNIVYTEVQNMVVTSCRCQ